MDKANKSLFGNERLLSFFSSAVENGKIAHAYIFEGGRGSGKHTLARHVSCLLACQSLFEKPCLACESCRKITTGISPDVIDVSLSKEKKTIGVDQIRELRSTVFIKPSEEDVKIYIISNAEAMTVQAQNVFLKVLEEPPRGVYFLMLCENTGSILPTVKSRAPVLKMQIFSDEELSNYLLENNNYARALYSASPEEFQLIIRMAEGKIGEAERLILDAKSDVSHSKHEKAKKLIELSADSSAFSKLLLYVQKMAQNREDLLDILLYSMYATRDLMAVKKAETASKVLLFYSDTEYAEKIASRFTSAGVVKLYDEFYRAHEEIALNVNLNNTLNFLAYEIRKAVNI